MRCQLRVVGFGAALVAAVVGPSVGWGQGQGQGQGRGQGQGQEQGPTGVIVGQVSDKDLQQPIAGAMVLVVGTTLGAHTSEDGHFRIAGAPHGHIQVRAMRLGYATLTLNVTVTSELTATVNFDLARVAAQLNQVVTTATQEVQSRRQTGADIAVVQADSIPQAVITDFSQMLDGRTPGVVVEPSSGETGVGSTVRIRGSSSLYLTNEPIYFIDGIRLDNSPATFNISVGGQSPSRVDEIPEQDIESYEVLKGPTASALYGTAAANGIISITTKHGEEGPTHWDGYVEAGNIQNATHFPPNWGTLTQDYPAYIPGYPEAADCTLNYQALWIDQGGPASGGCLPDSTNGRGGIVTANPVMDHSPFRTGRRFDAGVDAHGGTSATTFFLSGTKSDETGIYKTNSINKATLRANANFQLTQTLGVAVSAGYLTQNLNLPQNDNGYYGALSDGYLGYPVNNTTDAYGHPSFGYNPIPPEQAYNYTDEQSIDHWTAGVTANWHPIPWLTFTSVTGLDQDNQSDQEQEPANEIYALASDPLGHRYAFRQTTQSLVQDLSATAVTHPFSQVTSHSTVGFQYYDFYSPVQGGAANGPVPYTVSLNGALITPSNSETTSLDKQIGILGSEELDWRDRRYITASLRADKNSSFGQQIGWTLYPAANLSWVISDEDFWARNSTVSSLRFHSAYGASGLTPGSLDAKSYYDGGAQKINGVEQPSLQFGGIGANLKPERSNEVEGGLEWGFFKEKVTLDVTGYFKRTDDALVQVPVAGSAGSAESELLNLGAVSNAGIEVALNATVVDAKNFEFDVALNFAGNRNRVISLGAGRDTIILYSGNQRFVAGYPAAGFWSIPPDSFPAQSANGISGLENLYWNTSGEDPHKFVGSSIPSRTGSFSPTFMFFRTVRLSALFDYRGGYKQFDASEQFRCTFGTCRGNNDPTDSWRDKACAAYALNSGGLFDYCYIEDADFVKLREVSVQYLLPGRWARAIRAGSLSVTLAGRNLATLWTPFKGLDPETDSYGQDNFNRYQFAVQPLARYITLRVNVSY